MNAAPLATTAIARLGDVQARLLAGPPAEHGEETLQQHRARLGDVRAMLPVHIRSVIRESGLEGRGGGAFPVWRKLEAAVESPGTPCVIVNCSESEPGSRKDWTLCTYRPHLVLDGAAALARSIGATEVTLHLHRTNIQPALALARAMVERDAFPEDLRWGVSRGPGGYVAGESSAVARFVHEGVAVPAFATVPLARRGPSGRPTVVSNAETAAQVGLLLRLGPDSFGAAGTPNHPGSFLATITGGVGKPGTVVEVVGPATIGQVLHDGADLGDVPLGVLVGGYAGTWLPGSVGWHVPMDPAALAPLGASRGCGFLGVLPFGACGITETARLARYLAGESAGQCGPCVHGLPQVSEQLSQLARGDLGGRGLRRLHGTLRALPESGACRHPDGVVRLVQSALTAFDADVAGHRLGMPCAGSAQAAVFETVPPEERAGTPS